MVSESQLSVDVSPKALHILLLLDNCTINYEVVQGVDTFLRENCEFHFMSSLFKPAVLHPGEEMSHCQVETRLSGFGIPSYDNDGSVVAAASAISKRRSPSQNMVYTTGLRNELWANPGPDPDRLT